ncbi:hypothetical protein M2459_000470 [Parabacteroides sp. PF5-5]|uniref:DUF6261 family protein n=1 Tax=unclassified Parabacteroides TaxID=2649774 RepID=UPI00247696E5|nr:MULTISPECIES: DUF6261 family protein [unclassified Parabacteroides]MDH6314918.1 hypothetical protein [Parabacteroides sp. PF5-13]MDH6325936.1 hypothetical protein [Parabacteroides sp. PH5-41]MDH6333736.1 hypothetical protein [Parabacteroides sp. PF5-5]MDH6344801.1 hypothetical protein [Parabacteroides sp. PH5-46]MDH6359929.1 hypothetical protein [Parabacteroides sp. PH5-16]
MKKVIAHMGLLGDLTNAEHFDTHEAIIEYGTTKHALIPGFTAKWTVYAADFQIEIDEFNQSMRQPATEEIAEADALRDESFQQVKRTADYYAFSRIEAKKAAGILLQKRLETYKGAGEEAYTKNSALITKLLIDLRKPRYAEAIQELGLEAELVILETQNNRVKSLYRTRAQALKIIEQRKMAEARRAVDLSFSAVADALVVSHENTLMVTPDSELVTITGNFIDVINAYLSTASDNLARHTLRSGKEIPDDFNPPAPPDPPGPVHLEIAEQVTYEEETMGGLKMSLRAQHPNIFNRLMPPTALGGVVRMLSERDEVRDFPIIEFMMSDDEDDPKVIGLVLAPFKETAYFLVPFEGERDGPVTVLKDDEVLVILDGVSSPMCTTLD